MTIRNAIAAILACTLLFAFLGASIGYALGVVNPGYYRAVIRSGSEPGFDPIGVGVGRGLTQGTAGGVVVGLVLVALLCGGEVLLRRSAPPTPAPEPHSQPSVTAGWMLLGVVFALALGLCMGAGFFVGLLVGEQSTYHRRFKEEQQALAPVLAADPIFAELQLQEYSGGGVLVSGEVPTVKDLARLKEVVIRVLGEQQAKQAMSNVSAKP